MQCLALFDLDHTLLPIDSDYEWGCFLGRIGAVDPQQYEARNQAFYERYQAGTLVIEEFLAFALEPLARHDPGALDDWHRRFMEEVIEPALRSEATALIDRHRVRGDLCAVVTATNDFVTAPIARAFGIEHLVATRAERIGGRFTGRHAGIPSYREGKVVRVEEWLRALGRDWTTFDETWFYSDSSNDLALLERVSHPVATNPDPGLRARALASGWPVIDLFQ
ncbi:MAG: HAD family hydrolase [Burkholderiaceae bacterium]